MSQQNQRDKILALLKSAGKHGVTNIALNEIAFRYGGRIHELRADGWDIETRAESKSVFRFVLKGRKAEQLSLL